MGPKETEEKPKQPRERRLKTDWIRTSIGSGRDRESRHHCGRGTGHCGGGTSRGRGTERVIKMVYLKAADGSSPGLSNKRANPLLKFSSITSGRQLFAQENSDTLSAAVQQRLCDTDSKSTAGVYQNVLKERWDSLSSEEQTGWNTRAEAEAGNIIRNQHEFVETMSLALRDLCQGGLLGDSEMVLWYAFREAGNEDLMAGSIHGHSAHNQIRFGVGQDDLHTQYEKAWWDFADNSIPRLSSGNPVRVNSCIPRNSAGQPILPSIDLNSISMADMCTLLGEYFDQCWGKSRLLHGNFSSKSDRDIAIAHRTIAGKVANIPWEDIVTSSQKYYDAQSLSIALDHPQNLSGVQILTLAQGLLATSVGPTPFRFLEAEEEVLIPSSPTAPPPSASPAPSSPSKTPPSLPGTPPKSPSPPPEQPPKSKSPSLPPRSPSVTSVTLAQPKRGRKRQQSG
ncbi:hypothetical protein B0H13DRAFT_1875408 [Mycena leptocephala]|nr:hypothetical protein B0H13DRAFT_1875408 [Mycena leptocephala]